MNPALSPCICPLSLVSFTVVFPVGVNELTVSEGINGDKHMANVCLQSYQHCSTGYMSNSVPAPHT